MLRPVLVLLVLCVAAATPARSQVATGTVTADIDRLAKLSFSTNAIALVDGDPDVQPVVDSAPITIVAKVRSGPAAVVTLSVEASDDLRSGTNVIPAGMLSWVASGPGFTPGTVMRQAPRVVATWTGSGVYTGTQTYRFQNRWSYAFGTYTTTLVYTLVAP